MRIGILADIHESLTNLRLLFVGHFHRWLLAAPEGLQPWSGDRPIVLDAARRYLVSVHAVCDGRCALFDTGTNELNPFFNHGSVRC